MRWLPIPRHNIWWLISGIIGLGQFVAISVGAQLLLPHANPKYPALALFSLAIGLIIGGAGWLGARWLPPITILGLVLGLVIMLSNFAEIDGWGDIVGLLSYTFLLLAGFALGLVVELGVWAYHRMKASRL